MNITVTEVPDGHGGDDYEDDEGDAYNVTAERDGAKVGRLQINVTEDEIHVRWVEVKNKFRRQGIATALVRHAEQRFPGRSLETNGFDPSGDGEEWWDSLTR